MRKVSESRKDAASREAADSIEFMFSTPAAAGAAADVLEAQLKPFVDVQSRVEAKGSRLAISISGAAESRGTARLCAKRLAELMLKAQDI